MQDIIFASRNTGKIEEVETILEGSDIRLLSLKDYPSVPEISEDGNTFLENALKKARTVSELTGKVALADDSGLAVEALNGVPGIYSSRYAGPDAADADNIAKLLQAMKDVPDDRRGAAFICVLVLYYPGGTYLTFEGRWQGRIHSRAAGTGGFGYDPVFYLPEKGLTAAELPRHVKNRISHRAVALKKLKEAIAQQTQRDTIGA